MHFIEDKCDMICASIVDLEQRMMIIARRAGVGTAILSQDPTHAIRLYDVRVHMPSIRLHGMEIFS